MTSVGECHLPVHIVNVYGFANAGSVAEAATQNEEFISKVFSYLATFGEVPFIFTGDFNVTPTESPTIYAALQTSRWREAAELQQQIDGSPDMPSTCFVHETSKGSRIDSILLSQGLSASFRTLQIEKEEGVPVHRALRLTLDLNFCQQHGHIFHLPRAFPPRKDWADPDGDAEEYQQWEACQRVIESTRHDWEQAQSAQDPEAMLASFSASSEAYMAIRSLGHSTPPKAFQGRGKAVLKQHSTHAPFCDEAGATDTRHRSMLKLTRKVEELVRKFTHRDVLGPITEEWWNIWDKCMQSRKQLLPSWSVWKDPEIPDLGTLKLLSRALRELSGEERDKVRKQRADAWRIWFEEDWSSTRKRTYDFVRGNDRTPSCALLSAPGGGLTGDVKRIDAILHEEWMKTFRLYDSVPPPSWDVFKTRYGHIFPPRLPYVSPVFTGEMVMEALKHMSSDTSCGVDGWRVWELKCLPMELLERLAQLQLR